MSAITGLLRSRKPTPTDFARSLKATLYGIAECTVEGAEEELSAFREGIQGLAAKLHERSGAEELEITVTHALDMLREYNERKLKFNSVHAAELKMVMRTMTETITYLSESRTRSVHQLQFMERELEQTTQIEDIRLLRSRLIACLDVVREETVRLQSESQSRSTEVRQQLDRATKILTPPPAPPTRFGSMDSVTGLPARRAAETAISEALSAGTDYAVSVFVVTRLASINAKYGRAVGDEVMLRVANHFAQHLSAATFLFRWSGPALVALLDVKNSGEEVKRSWTKAAAVRQQFELESKQRSLLVMVETAMSFQLVNKATPADDLFGMLDRFVAERAEGAGVEASV